MTTLPDITSLIPQREPILMVDALTEACDNKATTCLTVRADNMFVDDSGHIEETGLMEHIAQSASALAGYKALQQGATQPPVGYIGEIKKFHCYGRPRIGDTLTTTVAFGMELNGITTITAQTIVHDIVAVETQMKIYVAPTK